MLLLFKDLGKGNTEGTGHFGIEEDWEDELEFADYNGIAARKRFPESFLFQTNFTG